MKKIILTVAAVFALTFANAQDFKSKRGENFMPQAGDWAISFGAAPFLNYTGKILGGNATSPVFESPVKGGTTFVGKKFITDKTAYRVVANIGFGSNNYGEATDTAPNAVKNYPAGKDTYKNSSFDLNVGLGKEWRRGSTRLQGYYGADAMIGISSSKWTVSDSKNPGQFTYTDGMNIKLGVNGFLGAEYFILPKIAIGAQYSYGLNIVSQGASKTTETGSPDSSGVSRTSFNLGNVSVATMNLTLHF